MDSFITFIQKFLLLLGTPILALTVILFSILFSTGWKFALSGAGMTVLGIIVYYGREKVYR